MCGSWIPLPYACDTIIGTVRRTHGDCERAMNSSDVPLQCHTRKMSY